MVCSRVNFTVPLYDYRFLLHHSYFPIRNGVVMSVSEVTDYKLKGRCEILRSGTVTGVTFPGFTQTAVYWYGPFSTGLRIRSLTSNPD